MIIPKKKEKPPKEQTVGPLAVVSTLTLNSQLLVYVHRSNIPLNVINFDIKLFGHYTIFSQSLPFVQ